MERQLLRGEEGGLVEGQIPSGFPLLCRLKWVGPVIIVALRRLKWVGPVVIVVTVLVEPDSGILAWGPPVIQA